MELAARTGAWSGKTLPYDAEVEWIRSVIGPYINTGYIINNKSNILCSISFESRPESYGLQAFQNGATYLQYDTGNFRTIFDYQSSNLSVFVSGVTAVAIGGYRLGDKTLFQADLKNKICKINDLEGRLSFQLSGYYDLPWFLFARNHLGNPQWLCDEKMYFARFYTDDELVLDLIPVRFTNENGVSEGAMYDRVSGQLFRNAGTGAFIIGPDKTT